MSQLQLNSWRWKIGFSLLLLPLALIVIGQSFGGYGSSVSVAQANGLSYVTLKPADIVTYKGATGGNQPAENLHVWDQNGDATDWDRYVQFNATSELYVGYRSYYAPSDVDQSSLTKLAVHTNYRGPSTSQQVWTWYAYNWTTNGWDRLGNNSGANWSAWEEFYFSAPNDAADYVNNGTREIRIYVESNNTSAYMQLDYEAVILESYNAPSSGGTTTVSYQPTTDLFPNPERGFTRAAFESFSSDPEVWPVQMLNFANDVEFLSGQEEAINTQVSCYFLLDKYFVHSTANNNVYIPIEASFLQNIEQNLDKVRRAGKKCVLTFAYSDPDMYPRTVDDGATEQSTDEQRMIIAVTGVNENTPGTMRAEPDLPHIMAHLDQLKPILERNSDVIAVMKTGLIGIWGEWHYTTHFLDNPFSHDDVSASQQGRRNQVVNKLLEVLPADRTIMLRRPFHKQPVIGGRTEPVRDYEAFANTPVARIGYHNDAFINVNGDMGTYGSQADRNYMSQETLYLPMGGETNWIPNNANVDRGCSNTISEMSTFHWSFIAGGYYAPTIKGWRDNNCIHNPNNIQGSIIDRLGYRFRLTKGVYPNSATAGSQMSIQIDLVNEGFAAPYNGRNVFLVLKNQATGDREYIYMPVDPRFWLAGQQHVIDQTVTLPSNLAPGQYQLALVLPDSHPNLSGDSRYAVRFANANLWPRPNLNNWSADEWPSSESQSKGLWSKDLWDGTNNLLHTVTVTN